MLAKTRLFIFAILSVSLLLFSCHRTNQAGAHKPLIYTPHGQDLLRDFIARYCVIGTHK